MKVTQLKPSPDGMEAVAWPWNARREAINPYLAPQQPAPPSALSRLIALYAADNALQQSCRRARADAVWQRYFFNDARDPVSREMAQDALVGWARMAHERQQADPDLVVLADVRALPGYISKPLLAKIHCFQRLNRPQALSRYVQNTLRPCLERLDHVRDARMSASFRGMAGHPGLEGLLVLPEMSANRVRRLATLVAAHMSLRLDAASRDLFVRDDVTREQIRQAWESVAAETLRLAVIPPAFEQLRRKKRRRKPLCWDLIPPSLARMLCANWWYRKLWQMRCEWREEQLRALCLVSRKASPYASYEAVVHKREQRRRSLAFFQSHQLVSEEGVTLEMEDVVNASSSNPAHRRNEMMACVKGLELIAEMRGDCAMFYTVTCPSRFHATLSNGRPNPGWGGATVRQSSDYLVATFAAFRKAMHKAGRRWYGVRVAEPHHDGTVHWHLLCFMRKKERRAITALLRQFAVREDREELGNNTEPRFKAEPIDSRKGSATGYIAKYVSKNIDGRGLAQEISKESGKSLRDSTEHVTAWASLHRVQQFRFFGIPGRQAYRELRLLAGQLDRKRPAVVPPADRPDLTVAVLTALAKARPALGEPRLDAVLAAADVGCFATYIMAQGGVLVPRRHHLVRTAYRLSEAPGAYGDRGKRIYGIWSPVIDREICTHALTWKRVRKVVDVEADAAADPGACASWTRGNNCPPGNKTGRSPQDETAKSLPDYRQMPPKQRRALLTRLRQPGTAAGSG